MNWRVFNWLVLREAVYRLGESPLSPWGNHSFRVRLKNLRSYRVQQLGRRMLDRWPERRIRP